jgi:predicted PurR-regulated permease PerM
LKREAPSAARTVAALLVAAALGWLAYAVRNVLAPLAAGLLLAYALNPLVGFLERAGLTRFWAAVALFAAGAVLIVAAAWLIVPPAVRSSVEFVRDTVPKIREKLPELHQRMTQWIGEERMEAIRKEGEAHIKDLTGAAGRTAQTLLGKLAEGLRSLTTALSWIVLVPIYCFFALLGMNRLWAFVQQAIPTPIRPRALATLARIHRANAAFFRGQTTVCLIKTALAIVLYGLTGLPFWLAVGIVHGLLSFFPFVGTTVTFMLVAVLSFVDAGGLSWTMVGPIGALVALELLEQFALQPMILGRETGLHPVMVVLAFLIAGELFGLFGLLVAVPLFTAGLIVFKDYVVPLYFEVGDRLSADLADGSPPASGA